MIKLYPVSMLPDTDELVIGWCSTRQTRAGEIEPVPITYAASILKRDLEREPTMPPHLQTGIDVFVYFDDLLSQTTRRLWKRDSVWKHKVTGTEYMLEYDENDKVIIRPMIGDMLGHSIPFDPSLYDLVHT